MRERGGGKKGEREGKKMREWVCGCVWVGVGVCVAVCVCVCVWVGFKLTQRWRNTHSCRVSTPISLYCSSCFIWASSCFSLDSC